MDRSDGSRRAFVARSAFGLGGIALATLLPKQLVDAHEHAHRAAFSGKFTFLTEAEAADVKAFGAQVIPTDETPGANEANVVYFIDHVLTEYEPETQKPFREAIKELDKLTKGMFPKGGRFARHTAEQQMAIVSEFEKAHTEPRRDLIGNYFGLVTSPFLLMRDYVVAGLLSEPELGGNKGMVGWQLIGYDGMAGHEPPFGFYDAELLTTRKEPN